MIAILQREQNSGFHSEQSIEPAKGFGQVYYPGQLEGIQRAKRRAEGLPIEPGLAEELTGLGCRFQVAFPE